MRIGTGYDSHRFDAERELVLGGVLIPGHAGLSGHSDGDAVAHALIDALLGAAAAGNVGSHFPPTDAKWKGADSIELLRQAAAILSNRDFEVVNVDITVVCETPKIGPHVEAMRERLAGAMSLTIAQVSIKGKTNERMGWIGRGEGLAVHAVALIESGSTRSPL
ncbi:MAG: 2-C-methyl-D-erythritol 2,4-cyclodiphosphate synthase [Gemmatimonadetes bacterium]|nr:2-C-methyl-D-erythritol 2,4-cyclodiphosphate synthase [Gemmatimonadota bacterium]MDA1103808.1 2-C-methyl-D-erythritol 2,4-cyclodiphosphate synthase [Gemmatimonadota bacterium]